MILVKFVLGSLFGFSASCFALVICVGIAAILMGV